MRTTFIALAAAAALGVAGLATTGASAAPLTPAQLRHVGNKAAHAHYVHHPVRHRIAQRRFWAPGPWAFRNLPPYNCYRIAHGFICHF